jgi:hypothetical protein
MLASWLHLTRTVSLLEVFWTLTCSIGLFYDIKLFSRASGDLAALKRFGINSLREYAASTSKYLYGSLTAVQGVFVLVGLLAMMVPPAAGTDKPPAVISWILTIGFIAASVLLAVASRVNEQRRKKTIEKIRAAEDRGERITDPGPAASSS